MGAIFLALALMAAAQPVQESAPLESRALPIQLLDLQPELLTNFDLYDLRMESDESPQHSEVERHTIFRLRPHVGLAGGYDNGVLHGSVGYYLTIAEWGRWAFGTTSPEIGLARYHLYDVRERRNRTETQSTVLISLASAHFRGGYLRSINKMWYLNLEHIFDPRTNAVGSQFGLSFSNR